MKDSYELIDSGNQKKLEKFGSFFVERPCSQAVWEPKLAKWEKIDLSFSRENGKGWTFYSEVPEKWETALAGIRFRVSPTGFGHMGIFPEHRFLWEEMEKKIEKETRVLNLFAYSGAATLAAARKGAEVCHVDASKPMVEWARNNARLNDLQKAPVRWIVDDVLQFLKREKRRDRKYDGIILDPPSFGRGSKGQVFKIERDIHELLDLCLSLLSSQPKFFIFSCHTPGFTPYVCKNLLEGKNLSSAEAGELVIPSENSYWLPSGVYGKWK